MPLDLKLNNGASEPNAQQYQDILADLQDTLIYEANREVIGPDPNVIIAGQVLFIPISS